MDKKFLHHLFQLHTSSVTVPSSDLVCEWLNGLLGLMFPELAVSRFTSERAFLHAFATKSQELCQILDFLADELPGTPAMLETQFMNTIPAVHRLLEQDAAAILVGDPAANSLAEVVRSYPGFYAIAVHRIAHEFYKLEIPLIPRLLAEHAHSKTGIDIHPGATIGEQFCIDHGTGVVIGETTFIGQSVKIYQGVTLGALSVQKSFAKTKRHPTIGDNVVIYAGATILGGETLIGNNAIIGGNTWITASVAPDTQIYYKEGGMILKNKKT